jgi:hypothetical protein
MREDSSGRGFHALNLRRIFEALKIAFTCCLITICSSVLRFLVCDKAHKKQVVSFSLNYFHGFEGISNLSKVKTKNMAEWQEIVFYFISLQFCYFVLLPLR